MNKHAGELSFVGILGCVVIPALDIVSDVLLDLSICASTLFPMFNRFVMFKKMPDMRRFVTGESIIKIALTELFLWLL